jgi:hypothetical protein
MESVRPVWRDAMYYKKVCEKAEPVRTRGSEMHPKGNCIRRRHRLNETEHKHGRRKPSDLTTATCSWIAITSKRSKAGEVICPLRVDPSTRPSTVCRNSSPKSSKARRVASADRVFESHTRRDASFPSNSYFFPKLELRCYDPESTSKCNHALHSAARFRRSVRSSIRDIAFYTRLFGLARHLPLGSGMKLWERHIEAAERPPSSRHEFVIGPLRESNLSSQKARIYYCRLCEWSFLVCGSRVAVIDEDGQPLVGRESCIRFSTFGEGPCPVLEEFSSAYMADVDKSQSPFRSEHHERSNLASGNFPTRPARPRFLLRVFTGLRENIGRRA